MAYSNNENRPKLTHKPYDLIQIVRYLFIGIVIGLIYIGVAGISFYLVIRQFCGNINDVLDAIYFPIVLMTSSGYKDLTPHSDIAILLATFFALLGVVVFGVPMLFGAKILLPTQPKLKAILEILDKDPEVKHWSVIKIRWKVPVGLLAVHMVGGVIFMVSIGKKNFFWALSCVFSTIITVLNDEKCFSTKDRRIFAVIWILFGMTNLSLLLYVFTEAWTERSRWVFAKELRKRNAILAGLQPSKKLEADGNMRKERFLMLKLMERIKARELGMEVNANVRGSRVIDNDEEGLSLEEKLQKYLNIDDLWEICIFFFGYLGLSIVIFYAARDHISGEEKTNSILDTIYFVVVIMTSVGYGDLQPNKGPLALTLATIFAIAGIILFGQLLSIGTTSLGIQQENRPSKDPNTATAKKLIKKQCKRVAIYYLVLIVVGMVIIFSTEDLDFIHALYCISITITSAEDQKEPTDEESKPAEPKADKPKPAEPKADKPKPAKPKAGDKPPFEYYPHDKPKPASDYGHPGVFEIVPSDGTSDEDYQKELQKLLATKLVTEEDIKAIKKNFDRLDVNHTGRLTLRQVMLSKR
ncbi:hypothetical protein L6452_39995 [Arctium lappa]|uniref:Uncharacterized protein n=1 Tax=Arctium lappa TaxID=4217 RepID=A0ACB8XUP5_ARCLA|nr:hypothetical protein L6452_39995 [Arctium lappa]